MPVYNVGEHRIDHPPLFACREHKTLVRLSEKFVEDILAAAEDVVPGNLSEYTAPMLGGNEAAMKLPDYLIPPRVTIFNPDMLRGPEALPFAVIFIDKKFIGIPAKYFSKDRFEGCPECGTGVPTDAAGRATTPPQGVQRPGSGLRHSSPSSPAVKPPSGPMQKPTPAKPGSSPGMPGIQRRAPIPGLDQAPGQKPPRRP